MKTLKIDRSRWLCGAVLERNGKESMLCNGYGQMCCLGFLGEWCGIPIHEMEEVYTPDTCSGEGWPKGVLKLDNDTKTDTPWTAVAIRINDNKDLTNRDRECMLTDHFKGINIQLVFTGSYPKGTDH